MSATHPFGFLQDCPSFVVVVVFNWDNPLSPVSTVYNNLGSFLEPENRHQLGRQKKACRGTTQLWEWKTFEASGQREVAAKGWGLEHVWGLKQSTAKGWQLHLGNQITLVSSRFLKISLVMTFHMIDLYFSEHAKYAIL